MQGWRLNTWILTLLVAAPLLVACPDSTSPRPPPRVPTPKVEPPAAQTSASADWRVASRGARADPQRRACRRSRHCLSASRLR
jgi:hypothetical protein